MVMTFVDTVTTTLHCPSPPDHSKKNPDVIISVGNMDVALEKSKIKIIDTIITHNGQKRFLFLTSSAAFWGFMSSPQVSSL